MCNGMDSKGPSRGLFRRQFRGGGPISTQEVAQATGVRDNAIDPANHVRWEGFHLEQLRLRHQGGQHVIDFVTRRGGHGTPTDHRQAEVQGRFHIMNTPPSRALSQLASITEKYRQQANLPELLEELAAFAERTATDDLFAAADAHADIPEVLGPLMEVVVDREPNHARALVRLANAYWLTGRGPDVVGELAARALTADPSHRGAWHLWALTDTEPRGRMHRWLQVTERFPEDELAKANLADNAASVGAAEDDPVALKLALDTFAELRRTAKHPQQAQALDQAMTALRLRR